MLRWQDFTLGGIVTKPGSASEYRTGDWRSQRPIWDYEKCIKCGLCYIYCPDSAIEWRDDGYPQNNLYYCKGCGICAYECWPSAIHMAEEVE